MAIMVDNVEEKRIDIGAQHSPIGFADDERVLTHKEAVHAETAHQAAERGHAATDK
jgi:hypothetical protein